MVALCENYYCLDSPSSRLPEDVPLLTVHLADCRHQCTLLSKIQSLQTQRFQVQTIEDLSYSGEVRHLSCFLKQTVFKTTAKGALVLTSSTIEATSHIEFMGDLCPAYGRLRVYYGF